MVTRTTQGTEKSAKAGAYGDEETRPQRVSRNPQRTHAMILDAATEEFAAHGFGGARVDAIAARAQTNKRMLYHYFGDKEGLYVAVLEATYAAIRSAEKNLDLTHRNPEEGMRELALFTWHHFLDHPEFLSLLVTENLHEARYLKRSDKILAMHSHFIGELARYGDRVTLWPEDTRGMLPLDEILSSPSDGVFIYCCGPEGLLTATERQCAAWPVGALHVERFAAKPQPEAAVGGDSAFEVVCRRSGVTVMVPPDKSIIEVLEENGVSVLSSCLEGVCGTCETAVLAGTPDHRDSLLTQEERETNEYMMVCVGRALSDRLELDL